ncbi:UNVERIFIED_CONTAM: dihydrofolate reductase [Jeotgalibacillus campisalis]
MQIDSGMEGMDALLLGRRTCDIFASYWPYQGGGIAQLFNRIPKYVASRQSLNPEWEGTSQLGPDVWLHWATYVTSTRTSTYRQPGFCADSIH